MPLLSWQTPLNRGKGGGRCRAGFAHTQSPPSCCFASPVAKIPCRSFAFLGITPGLPFQHNLVSSPDLCRAVFADVISVPERCLHSVSRRLVATSVLAPQGAGRMRQHQRLSSASRLTKPPRLGLASCVVQPLKQNEGKKINKQNQILTHSVGNGG